MTPYPQARILVIDDNVANVMLVDRALRREGYSLIDTVLDSREAVERFVAFKPDLVILDLVMPHLDGYQVHDALTALMRTWPVKVPVLVLTADANARAKCWDRGLRDFISKPIEEVPYLWARVETLLEIRFLRRELAAHQDDDR
jgi:CheY-like chemotaxis protein